VTTLTRDPRRALTPLIRAFRHVLGAIPRQPFPDGMRGDFSLACRKVKSLAKTRPVVLAQWLAEEVAAEGWNADLDWPTKNGASPRLGRETQHDRGHVA
jgi:hypothetical protein